MCSLLLDLHSAEWVPDLFLMIQHIMASRRSLIFLFFHFIVRQDLKKKKEKGFISLQNLPETLHPLLPVRSHPKHESPFLCQESSWGWLTWIPPQQITLWNNERCPPVNKGRLWTPGVLILQPYAMNLLSGSVSLNKTAGRTIRRLNASWNIHWVLWEGRVKAVILHDSYVLCVFVCRRQNMKRQ